MPHLIWSPRALADLARLQRFLAERNPEAGRQAVRAIREGMRMIETFPEAGRPARDMALEYRERWIAFGNVGYLTRYHFDGVRILVVAVRHGRELGW